MSRHFLSGFILPLLKGGILHVGRPVRWSDLERLLARLQRGGDSPESRDATEVARLRQIGAAGLSANIRPMPLDFPSMRLLAAAHNLMLLGHPEMKGRDHNRLAALAQEQADMGPPGDQGEAVARYSLLAHLPEAVCIEHQVQIGPSWLRLRLEVDGRALGQPLRALARLPSAQVRSRRRSWWKEIGVPPCAAPAVEALFRSCPVLEAMDPLRLYPPLSWRRILPVLRFPSVARAVANRVWELGVESAGSALAGALLRFASVGDGREPLATPEETALAIRFVAHLFWLEELWGDDRELGVESDVAALLAAAADVDRRLLWPPDIHRQGDLGERFARSLQRLMAVVPQRIPERYRAMRAVCALAVSSALVRRQAD